MDTLLINSIGLIGGLFFAFCGVPQAIKTIKAKKHLGTPLSISFSITAGSILMYIYLLLSYGFDPILAVNYFIEIVSWAILLGFGFKEKRR